MAVNILGQNIQLLLNQTQGADIAKGLQIGEVLQARLTEILPDNRAIIQIKGMNLLAALPPSQPGQTFVKGALLDLAVLQAKTAPAQTGSQSKSSGVAPSQTPALSLKLLGVNLNTTAPLVPISQSSSTAPLSRPSLENLLIQAQVPVNNVNLHAAQSLSRHGLSLDKASINFVVQTVEAMIHAENALQSSLPVAALPAAQDIQLPVAQDTKLLSTTQNFTVRTAPLPVASPLNVLTDAKSLLNILVTQPNRAVDRPIIQKMFVQLDHLLNQDFTPIEASKSQVITPAPASQFVRQTYLPENITAILQQIEAATTQIEKAPLNSPQALPRLEVALNALEATLPVPGTIAVNRSVKSVSETNPTPSINLSTSIKKEVVAAVIRELAQSVSPEAPIKQQELLKKIDMFSAQVSQPKSDIAKKIVLSAKNQLFEAPALPNAKIQSYQSDVLQALSQIKDSFIKQPLPSSLKNEAALLQAFDSRNLGPAPQIALESLPRETVQEAVVFLKARSLPPTRALVETVAIELSKTTNLATTIQNIASLEPQIPQGVLVLHPNLKQAFENLKQFLSENGIKPEDNDVWTQIQNFVSKSGLNLEKTLANISAPDFSARPMTQNPEHSLKAVLLKLKDEVQRVTNQPLAQASPEITGKLEHLGSQINSAINTMHTLALSARPTPAFDITTVQLPVYIGGQMQSGQLSIYWKRGRPHELSVKDPVNVVFLLNTRGLGEVKVQLQVWKNECQCRVTVASDAARDFIKSDTKEFKTGFEKNTRFKLSSLDVATKDALSMALSLGLNQLPTAFESLRPGGGTALNLTA